MVMEVLELGKAISNILIIFVILLLIVGCSSENLTIDEKEKVYYSYTEAIAKLANLVGNEMNKEINERDIDHVIEILSDYYTGDVLNNINQYLLTLHERGKTPDVTKSFIGKIPFGKSVSFESVKFEKVNENKVLLTYVSNVSDFLDQEFIEINGEKVYKYDNKLSVVKEDG